MTHRNARSLLRGLAFATAMTGAGLAGGPAFAQQVIVLETIGAVRMAQPEEIRRKAAEQDVGRPSVRPQPSRDEREASAR